jgi:hypothetical protein
VWDPDDVGHRLDIRWVGVYQQAGDTMRVSISLYDRVQLTWFKGYPRGCNVGCAVSVELPSWAVFFFLNRNGHLTAGICDPGSACPYATSPVDRPNSHTIRAWFPTFLYGGHHPFTGEPFRPASRRPDYSVIDRAREGIVT